MQQKLISGSINLAITESKKPCMSKGALIGAEKSFYYGRKIMAGSCVTCGARVKFLTTQHNRSGINFFSIQECNCGIRSIRGKMRSTVWTVQKRLILGIFLIFKILYEFFMELVVL